MQPFGLFSFLQSLLGEQNPTASPVKEDAPNPEKAENSPTPTSDETPSSQENMQAVLQFLQAHDSRVARTKKR